MKQIRVWQDIFSSKRKIIWKASIALILNKCPKMDENECNLAGDTITLNDELQRYSLYQICIVNFYDDKD